ncbi:MAG: CAP domain-containing protein [Nanoarchaeota archaeon]|nr:CAP domain-containing protein [Nanoarchaeota archaeon]
MGRVLSVERRPRAMAILSGVGWGIHLKINHIRKMHGCSLLHWEDQLAGIARTHSLDMADRQYFAHVSPEGKSLRDRYHAAGYEHRVFTHRSGNTLYYAFGGENIFQTNLARLVWNDGSVAEYQTKEGIIAQVVDGWMHSPGHRKNILTKYWQHEGIGVAVHTGNRKVYITENFS